MENLPKYITFLLMEEFLTTIIFKLANAELYLIRQMVFRQFKIMD